MLDNPFFWTAKIFPEPDIDTWYFDPAAGKRNPAGMIDKITGCFFKQQVQILGSKRLRLEVGTAEAGTVNSIVNPIVLPDRTQNAMFDIIQGDFLAFNCQ